MEFQQPAGISAAMPDKAGEVTPPLVWSNWKRKRTTPRTGDSCRTCRLRKVKCGGRPHVGPCTNCSRLELGCNFADPDASAQQTPGASRTTPSQSHTEAGTLRKRAQRACSQCHSHKTKCSGDLPRCKRCEAGNLECEYTPARRKFAAVPTAQQQQQEQLPLPPLPEQSGTVQPKPEDSPTASSRHSSEPVYEPSSVKSGSATSPTTSTSTANLTHEPTKDQVLSSGHFPLSCNTGILTAQDLLMRKDLILRHLDAYYENLYWLPCLGIFHPATTHRQIQEGTFHPAQAAAVCGISSFFVSPTEAGREFGRTCANQVEFYVYRNCHKFDEKVLGAFVLNSMFNLLSGCYARVWHCSGMATRLMMGLQINWEDSSGGRTFIQQETIRRIAWQIFTLDRLLASGYDEYLSCRSELMRIRLPANDHAFRDNIELKAERLYDEPSISRNVLGLHGHQIRLVDLRHRIHASLRNSSAPRPPSQVNLERKRISDTIRSLQGDLTRIQTSLPDELQLNDQSIRRYVAAQERPGFVFMHAHLLAAHIDLYQFALPTMLSAKEAEPFQALPRESIIGAQKQAVASAICLARFCETVLKEFHLLPSTGRIRLAADCTIPFTVRQVLRVLLIALQYSLYQDLAQYTSVPWRNEPADQAELRGLIDSLLLIEEPFCEIFELGAKIHESNTQLVSEFYRTGQVLFPAGGFTKMMETPGDGDGDDVARHTGPPFVLENSKTAAEEEERRHAATEEEAARQWFGTPQSADYNKPLPPPPPPVSQPQAFNFLAPEMSFGGFGPPPLPMFLEEARGEDKKAMYDRLHSDMEVQSKPWSIDELNAMLGGNGHLLGEEVNPTAMAMVSLDGTTTAAQPDPGMYQMQAGMQTQSMMQPEAGMFLGYPQTQTVVTQEQPVQHHMSHDGTYIRQGGYQELG